MRLLAVVLAAGRGSRFHGAAHKLHTTVADRPLWRWAVDAPHAAGLEVVVVTGAVELDVPPELATTIAAAQWARGQAASLHAALRWIESREVGGAAPIDAVIVGLADQPAVGAEAWAAVAAAAPSPIVVARYGAHRGPHPVRLARTVWPLLPTDGDVVARSVIEDHPEWVTEVQCVGSGEDIDTLEDLGRWRSC